LLYRILMMVQPQIKQKTEMMVPFRVVHIPLRIISSGLVI